jgi:hypothetical protein
MQIKLRRANLAGPSVRSSVAIRLIWKLIPGTELSPRYMIAYLRSCQSPEHPTLSSLPSASDPHPEIEPGNQYP